MKEDDKDVACGTYERTDMNTKFWWEHLKERGPLEILERGRE
jgi:hypothetical protein